MKNKQKKKIVYTNGHNIKKKNLSPQNKIEQINFKTQTPLFRMFMDNNKIKKVHLARNTMNNSREETIKKTVRKMNITNNNNIFYNLRIVSYKILEAQYNMTPELYTQKIIFNLIRNKKGHLLSYYHDTLLFDNSLREFLKRSYKYKESLDKIPKYYNYYKNYLKYFCHPIFVDYTINKKMVKHMEKHAQVFYNKNYAPNVNNNENNELKFIIFNKRVIKDIEKVTIITDNPTISKDNKIYGKNNENDRNYTYVDLTPITTLTYGKNCPQVTKNSKYNYENAQNNEKSSLLNSEYNIINTKGDIITPINETNNSLKTLINELKENKNNDNINKNNFIISEEERFKRFMESPDISSANKINNELINQKNVNLKKTQRLSGFNHSNNNKIYLTNKYENLKRSIGNENNNNKKNIINNRDDNINIDNNSNQINKIEKPILNKKMIKNLNLNINQLIINNKIITSVHSNSRNKDYNKLIYKNKNDNNQILNEIKEIFKINNRNNEIDKNKNKKIIDFKTTIHMGDSNSTKLYRKLNRVNSMSKITPILININEKKDRKKNSNLRERNYMETNSLIKMGGINLESQGKIALSPKNKIIKKSKIISSDYNSKIFNNFNFTKINTQKRGKLKSNNNISSHDSKYNYIINSDKDIDARRSISNSKRTHIKIFKSGFNFNLSNEKSNINSGMNSPSNSLYNNNNKINNLKFIIQSKDTNNKAVPFILSKNIGQKFFGRKKGNDEPKLKLKNFNCIGNENKRNFNIFSPKKNTFRRGPISLKKD